MDDVEGRSWWRAFWRRTVWHPDAIPLDEWKYRSLKRIYLPIFDVIAILAGVWATAWGSPILRDLLNDLWIDGLGTLLSTVAAVCLLGVILPQFWLVEMFGKSVLVSLVGAYSGAIWLMGSSDSNGFVAWIVCLGLPLPLFRLTLLGEEYKERRSEARAAAEAAAAAAAAAADEADEAVALEEASGDVE